jgi:hypothetical protein
VLDEWRIDFGKECDGSDDVVVIYPARHADVKEELR